MNETKALTLPADVFDALELSALVFGGIGQPEVFDGHRCFGTGESLTSTPVCFLGHWAFVRNDADVGYYPPINGPTSDYAVRRINLRRRRPATDRVTWKAYTRELNIVRGD